MISLQQIARALGGEISGGQVLCPGPGHSKHDRSLSVKPDAKAPDGFIVYSHAGDNALHCKDYVREKLGFAPFKGNGADSATYDYRDEEGELLFQVVRREPKNFRQRRPDGQGGWLWQLGETRRVLYRLPELLEATSKGRTIFIAEGEKAVDALTKLGVTATCSPSGAGNWRDEYAGHFAGAGDVIILPDNDDAGEKHAADILRTISSARVLRLPGLPAKGDPFDWIAAGGTATELWKLLEATPAEAPVWPKSELEQPFKLVCFADVESAPINWLWRDYLARGKLTLLGGDPDLGKSQIAIDAAARLSRGAHWPFGARAPIGSTIFICSEDGLADTVKPRAEAAGADVSQLHALSSTLLKDGKLKSFTLKDDLDMLGAAVKKVGASLVIVDAITSYMGKVENNSTTDIRSVLDPVSQWAEELNVAVLGVTHP